MLTLSGFVQASAAALERVFGLQAGSAQAHIERAYSPTSEETAVAALRFCGDYSGSVCLLLPKWQARATVRRFLSRYAIDLPVEDEAVFAELLNMYAGNLLTAMQRYGAALDILPPYAPAGFAPEDGALFVRLGAGDSQTYTLLYQFDAGKSPL